MSHLRIEKVSTAHLQALSLELQDSECVGLSGPSGMGKSLFLRAIADLDLHKGRIWLDDHEQATIPAMEWRSRVGLLAAESAWWSEKVSDHFVNVDHEALKRLGFDKECLGWSTERMSSGEKQRLALLRLLSMQPEILLLDEPTANLDAEATGKVEALISDYLQGHSASVIWVSHDLKQLERVTTRHYSLDEKGISEVIN